MHISWSTSSARSKGGRSKRETCFSPFALSPPLLTSLFFFPQKRLNAPNTQARASIIKKSEEEKGTITATIPPPPN